MSRETFRRTLKEKTKPSSKKPSSKSHAGEIIQVAKGPFVTVASTTPIYDAIQIMTKEGFRRIPIADAGTKALEGIITATDIVDYLGGGKKFEIIEQRFGGNFFKALNQSVGIIMTKNVVSVKISAKISEAIKLMKEKNLGGLPVVDDGNRVRAIITERDIASLFADRISGVRVSQIMSEKVITALPKTTIFETEKTMAMQGFRRLPIISDGKVAGIITTMDIIRFFGSGEVFKHLRSGTIIQILNTPALQIATKEISTIEPNADVGKAAKIMRDKDIGALPVVEKEKLVGMITERDFFKIIE
ncbi:CBS domain-containing protein [Candidatus Bathyarchaeota archaeon]|nr:CBS domain-containing protein [Candidatus Bathyarchaeota archaeon]